MRKRNEGRTERSCATSWKADGSWLDKWKGLSEPSVPFACWTLWRSGKINAHTQCSQLCCKSPGLTRGAQTSWLDNNGASRCQRLVLTQRCSKHAWWLENIGGKPEKDQDTLLIGSRSPGAGCADCWKNIQSNEFWDILCWTSASQLNFSPLQGIYRSCQQPESFFVLVCVIVRLWSISLKAVQGR